jgi:uncharacterized protein (DUF1330 family)
MAIHPTEEQIRQLAESGDDGSLVMLNLLRFKAQADGIDEGVSGAEAYARYSAATEPFLRGVGGRLLSAIAPQQSVIGPPDAEWDLVLLVEYPSRQKFLEMAMNPEYLEIRAHREAALSDSRLVACASIPEQALAALGRPAS